MNNPYQNYFENQVKNASSEQVLVMLYEGAIRFLRQARHAIENNDRVGKLEKKSRAVAIISELSSTLDFEKGGEVAENLDGLYWYMIRELSRANGKDEIEAISVSENILSELREAWVQAIEQIKPKENAPEEAGKNAAKPSKSSMYAAI